MTTLQEVGQYIDLSFFVWPCSNAGYYIDSNAKPDLFSGLEGKVSGPFILETPETTGYLTTKPLGESPTLFLEFADTDGSEKSMIDFANQHGLLTEGILLENIPHNPKDINGMTVTTKLVRGDTLSTWQREHFVIKNTVLLWEWLKESNIEKLKLVICWYNNNKAVRYFIGTEDDLNAFRQEGGIRGADGLLMRRDGNEPLKLIRGELASELSPPGLLTRFVPGDVVIPAQTVMQRIINEKLREYPVDPMLLMDKNNNLKQYFVPKTLLSAMWFQFFQAASGERRHKRCEVCKKWEDVTEKKATWTKHPECAGRVRTAKYRERKEGKLN